MTQQPTGQDSNKQAVADNVGAKLKDLVNVNRIVTNAIALINDVEIKGAHAGPVTEILGWLTGFSQSLTTQIKTLEATLPKKDEAATPKSIPMGLAKTVGNEPTKPAIGKPIEGAPGK